MRKVKFKRYIPIQNEGGKKKEGTGRWEEDFTHEGLFHQWAFGYEEWDSGPANYTYAIVELPDGTIEEVLPTNLKFI